ncbi:hypothetical protein NMY22_g14058 [Coprinellus aureogranulatus]|nr:hypothetical protein NMY22_g14058 [Coprinellus aureogranulatus]
MFSHLASSFYHSSLSRYDDKCFEDKGYPPWVRSRLHQIKGSENMHIQFLEETIKGSGGEPVQKCEYNFPDHEPSHVVEFGEAIASIFVSALNGALKEVESKEYASAIGSILGVEARVSAWLNSAVKKQSPWNMAFETPVTFSQAYSILLNFISSCPPHNSDLLPSSLQRFPSLRLPSGGIESGVEIELEFDEQRYRKGGVLFGAFMVGTGTYIERVRIVEQCEKKKNEGGMSSGSGSGYGSGSGAGYSPSGDGNSASTPSSGYTSEISLEDHVKNRYFLTPPADLSGKGAVYITLVQSDTDVDREAAEVVSSILRDDNTVAGPMMAMFPFDSNGGGEGEVAVEVEDFVLNVHCTVFAVRRASGSSGSAEHEASQVVEEWWMVKEAHELRRIAIPDPVLHILLKDLRRGLDSRSSASADAQTPTAIGLSAPEKQIPEETPPQLAANEDSIVSFKVLTLRKVLSCVSIVRTLRYGIFISMASTWELKGAERYKLCPLSRAVKMLLPLLTALGAVPVLLHVICFASAAAVHPEVGSRCPKIYVHVEWRDMSIRDRLSYISGVKCLMELPSSTPQGKSSSRFEDFQSTHIDLTERIHLVGQFLPWHRHQVDLYGKALRNECGYKGPIAFWDWARDGDSESALFESPIFDPDTGFGGSGVPGTYTLPEDTSTMPELFRYVGCVQTGPFRDSVYTAHLGPGKLVTDHCLIRGVNESWKPMMRTEEVEKQMASKPFEEFRIIIDDMLIGIHGIGHAGVGGEMTNIWSAGADPLFYLHHLNLDRMWWHWQRRNQAKRLYEISGPTTQGGTDNVTLDFVMDFPSLGLNLTIRNVMDTFKEPNCYTFQY